MGLVLHETCIENCSPAPPNTVSKGTRVTRLGEIIRKGMPGNVRQVDRTRVYFRGRSKRTDCWKLFSKLFGTLNYVKQNCVYTSLIPS